MLSSTPVSFSMDSSWRTIEPSSPPVNDEEISLTNYLTVQNIDETESFETVGLLINDRECTEGNYSMNNRCTESVVENQCKNIINGRAVKCIEYFFSGEDFESETLLAAISKLLKNNLSPSSKEPRRKEGEFYICKNWTEIPVCDKPKIPYMTELFKDTKCLFDTQRSKNIFNQKYQSLPSYCNLTIPTEDECSKLFLFRNDTFVDGLAPYYRQAFCNELITIKEAKGHEGYYGSLVKNDTFSANNTALWFCIGINALSLLATFREEFPEIIKGNNRHKIQSLVKMIAQCALFLAPIASMSIPLSGSTMVPITSAILSASGAGLNAVTTLPDLYFDWNKYKHNQGNACNLIGIIRNTLKTAANGTQCALLLADVTGHLPLPARASLFIACSAINSIQLMTKGALLCSRTITPLANDCLVRLSNYTASPPFLIQDAIGAPSVFRRSRETSL